MVPSKGRHAYSVAELKKFIYETGRIYGILQYDKELTLKALVIDVAKELGGMSIRATTVDGDVPVCRNEDTEEIIEELKLVEPQLDYIENEFSEKQIIDGMQTEMKLMKNFDVYYEIPIANCSQEDIDNALDGTWVKRRQTATKVRCPLCVRGCLQETMD